MLDHNVLDDDFPRCEAAGVAIIVGELCATGTLATGAVTARPTATPNPA